MLSVKHYTSTEGYTYLLESDESGSQNLHFGILKLHAESTYFDHTEACELVLIPLTGRCTLLVGHSGNKANGILGARETVFESAGCAAFIPHHTTYEILPQSQNVEIAVCKTPSHYDAAAVINPSGPIETPPNYQLHIVENGTASEWIGEAVGFHRFQNEVGFFLRQYSLIRQKKNRYEHISIITTCLLFQRRRAHVWLTVKGYYIN